jgi:hypothetical protein
LDTLWSGTRHYKAKGNILYEIDGQPALNLYKLSGEKASELPQASLLYPLNVTPIGKVEPVGTLF